MWSRSLRKANGGFFGRARGVPGLACADGSALGEDCGPWIGGDFGALCSGLGLVGSGAVSAWGGQPVAVWIVVEVVALPVMDWSWFVVV